MGDKNISIVQEAKINIYSRRDAEPIWTQTHNETGDALMLDNDSKVKSFSLLLGKYTLSAEV